MLKRVTAGVVAVVSLGACADSTSSEGSQAVVATPEVLAQNLGCTGFTAVPTDEAGIDAAGTCVLEDSLIRVVTFNDPAARDSFVAMPGGGAYVTGATWAVSAESGAVAEVVRQRVGGVVTES